MLERREPEPSQKFSFNLFSKNETEASSVDDSSGSLIQKVYGSVIGFFSGKGEVDPIDIVELDKGGEEKELVFVLGYVEVPVEEKFESPQVINKKPAATMMEILS